VIDSQATSASVLCERGPWRIWLFSLRGQDILMFKVLVVFDEVFKQHILSVYVLGKLA
jgi:hypothetical protein